MAKKITLTLTNVEMSILRQSAALDYRREEEQARFLLRSVFAKELERYNENSDVTSLQGSHVAIQT
jgi:hypothetical protein